MRMRRDRGDVFEIVELLQHEVAGSYNRLQRLWPPTRSRNISKRHAVVQILARVDLEAGV